ncbi:MAG: hypothetical protein LBF69_02125 [Prevotellaceae bacterium]|jgi:uncharacterized protein (TIGR02145 family)|nr:hypothetical protein [Prevotellaceae bacterium]
MKTIIKKQCKKFPLWGLKGLLSMALSASGMVAHAQGAEVCTGTPYTIASMVDASGVSTYRWLENGQIISGASATDYTVPNNKVVGFYTYVRQAKSADCSEWQSSNVFAVTVFDCSFSAGTVTSATATFIDPRDGKRYKTVVMPDDRTWFAQNLNYTKDLTYNAYANEANGKPYVAIDYSGAPAIGSYWCPAVEGSVVSGTEADCRTYGALYTWETVMMLDGKYADDTKTSNAWDASWTSDNYYPLGSGAPATTPNADKNNARGGTYTKGGGRGICPMGWHVPTIREWAFMLDKVDGDGSGTAFSDQYPDQSSPWLGNDVGAKLKSAGTYTGSDPGDGRWLAYTLPSAPLTGFDVQPAGSISPGPASNFANRGMNAPLWTSTAISITTSARMDFSYSTVKAKTHMNTNRFSFAVRCVKD